MEITRGGEKFSKSESSRLGSILSILTLSILVFLTLCTHKPSETRCVKSLDSMLPDSLAGLQLSEKIVGEKALEEIRSSHRGRIENPLNATIYLYGNKSSRWVGVWLTEYSNESLAYRDNLRMFHKMMGFPQFSRNLRARRIKLDGRELLVFETIAPNGIHQYTNIGRISIYIWTIGFDLSSSREILRDVCELVAGGI